MKDEQFLIECGISTQIKIVAPATLERSLGKAKRVFDKRPKG